MHTHTRHNTRHTNMHESRHITPQAGRLSGRQDEKKQRPHGHGSTPAAQQHTGARGPLPTAAPALGTPRRGGAGGCACEPGTQATEGGRGGATPYQGARHGGLTPGGGWLGVWHRRPPCRISAILIFRVRLQREVESAFQETDGLRHC